MKRLLLVDDDIDILDCLEMVLGDHYAITLAANGKEALERLAEGVYDAVVLDLMMPILDGGEVLREMHRRAIDVPVILASASPSLDKLKTQLGASDFIAKPFDFERLETKLACLVHRSRGGASGSSAPGREGSCDAPSTSPSRGSRSRHSTVVRAPARSSATAAPPA